MGRNFYCIKKQPSLYNKAIHIGKSSAGWKFNFRGYQREPIGEFTTETISINSVDDWKEYLKNDDLVILDEYDKIITYDEFFELVEEKQKSDNPDNFKYSANINGYRFTFTDFS